MPSGCGDVLSLQDLQVAKANQLFEAEVITGKAGGVASGAYIPTATNMVTGQVQKTLPEVINNIGIERIGDFTTGCTVTARNQGVLEVGGSVYVWRGALPKVVPAGSTPSSTGGVYPAGDWSDIGDATIRALLSGPDHSGLDGFYGGGGWTGPDAGSGNLQGRAHTNAMRLRYDIKGSVGLDPIIWVEKETLANAGDTGAGDTGWDGGSAYFAVKKTSGTAQLNVVTGYARHNGGSGGMIGVQGRGSGQHIDAQVWGLWSYAEVGFGAAVTGVRQAISHEGNTCNRGPDMGWMPAAGPGAARGILSITADGTNRCTHAFYTGNHKSAGGSPGTGGWWTGYLVGANSIAANTNATTTYVGDGEAYRANGSGSSLYAYGGFRFYEGFFRYGTSYAEGSYVNNAAILMGAGKRIIWGDHVGSSRHLSYDATANILSAGSMGIGIDGVKLLGTKRTGIFQLTGTADGTTKNTETVTLQELARYVKKVTDALIMHGMIGPT